MVFEMRDLKDPAAAILAAMSPSKRPIVIEDSKLLELLPFIPRYQITVDGVRLSVIPGEYLEAVLNDQLYFDDSVLLAEKIPWATARFTAETLRGVLVEARVAGLEFRPYETAIDFVNEIRRVLNALPESNRPVASLDCLERSELIDFKDKRFSAFANLRWIEELSIQDMIQPGEARTRGWGLLSFTAHPCFEPGNRYSGDSAFCSLAGQWLARLSQERFGGISPAVRPGVIRSAGLEILGRALDLSLFLKLHNGSELRETELINLMCLASLNPVVVKPAFQQKIKDIVARSEEAGNIRMLIGRTDGVVAVNSLYSQLCLAWGIADGYSLVQLSALNAFLAEPRLDFLKILPGLEMSDPERVKHVVESKSVHNSVSERVKGGLEGSGKAEENGASLPTSMRIVRLEKLHLSERHQIAVQEITKALDKPGATKLSVREAVFKQAIPLLNRHMLGLETAVGCEIYERLLSYRCKPGASGDTDDVMGYFFGQQIMKGDDGVVPSDYRGFSLAGSGVVDKILKGKLHEINFENEILGKATLCKSNVLEEKVATEDRFLNYMNVDRMISEISTLFEALGLGSKCSADSFAAIMNECKVSLLAVRGLDELDVEDLLRGDRVGVQKYVIDALKAANSTLRALFMEKDPLAIVESGRLLPRDSLQFKHELALSRAAIQKRKSEQILFGSSYKRRVDGAGGAGGAELSKMKNEVKSLREEMDRFKRAKTDGGSAGKYGKDSKNNYESEKYSKNKSLKRKEPDSERAEGGKRSTEGKSLVDVSNPDLAVITDPNTKKLTEFKVDTLRKILQKVYKFTEQKAKVMCLGFGLDPRRTVAQRMLSCTCGDPKNVEAHTFPNGFTFTVRSEYRDFR